MRKLLLLLFLALLLPACQQQSDSATEAAKPKPAAAPAGDTAEAEIEAAIRSYLAGRPGLNMENMTVEFGEIKVQGQQAEADVQFRSKDGQGEMGMHYSLAKEGDQWVVQRPARKGTGEGEMPPGHPPVQSNDPASSH